MAGIAAFLWAWNSNPIRLRDRIFPRNLAVVYDGFLYRSGQIDANLVESTLADLEIDVIVDLTRDYGESDAGQWREARYAEREGIQRGVYPLRGSGTGRVEQFVAAVAAIARAEAKGLTVLVHCRAGDRRSSAVVATYQVLVRGEPPARAHIELGRFARNDYGRLVNFLDANMQEIAEGLVREGILSEVPNPLPRLGAATQAEIDRERGRLRAGS